MQNGRVVVGVDIGSWTFKISSFSNNQFTLLTNEANFRETPSLVAFHQHQRLVGEEANNRLKSNFSNTVRAPLRLIGLEKNFELIEEELKYATAPYQLGEELHFTIRMAEGKAIRLKPEHLLISLLSKMKRIVKSHGLQAEAYYVVVPSYLSHYERKIIQRCGGVVLGGATVSLVDDWVSLAAEYVYSHAGDIRQGGRTVVFVDIGYSKCSFFVVQFTQQEPRLLDCEHLRYMGCKNMDQLLAEHYDQMMKDDRNSSESVFASHKAKVKVFDQIEKQRKMLSANEESHISVEALFDDYELSYNMTRREFEKVVAPVLQEIRKGIKSIKGRMPPKYSAYSLELVGGASRIPFIGSIIRETFGTDPSRTLNQSESVARGAAIYGAVASKVLRMDYLLPNCNLIDICACWNPTGRDFFGENETQYKKREVVFRSNTQVPNSNSMSFRNEGPVEVYIFYGQAASTKTIGYLRFNTPNKLRFELDASKIVSVHLERGQFAICKMQDKKESRWTDITKWEEDLSVLEQRISAIHELKNQYESKFYDMRSKIAELKEFMTPQEFQTFLDQFRDIEQWIEAENNRSLSTAEDLDLYRAKLLRIYEYETAFKTLRNRKEAGQELVVHYNQLMRVIEGTKVDTLNEQQQHKLRLLSEWMLDSYGKMEAGGWEGYYLTENSLQFAQQEYGRIVGG